MRLYKQNYPPGTEFGTDLFCAQYDAPEDDAQFPILFGGFAEGSCAEENGMSGECGLPSHGVESEENSVYVFLPGLVVSGNPSTANRPTCMFFFA